MHQTALGSLECHHPPWSLSGRLPLPLKCHLARFGVVTGTNMVAQFMYLAHSGHNYQFQIVAVSGTYLQFVLDTSLAYDAT